MAFPPPPPPFGYNSQQFRPPHLASSVPIYPAIETSQQGFQKLPPESTQRFQLPQNNQLFHPQVNLGPHINPLAPHLVNMSEYTPNRDQLKDSLANSLAADPTIACLPGFSAQGTQNLSQRQFMGQCQPVNCDQNGRHQGFNVQSHPFYGSQPTHAYLHPAVHSGLTNGLTGFPGMGPFPQNSAKANFRRGRSGSWSHFGSSDQHSKNTPEAKAKRESYRHELEKQIEQAKLRKQEDERREKDINEHPLGTNYAQPKQLITPKFVSSSSTALEINQKPKSFRTEMDVTAGQGIIRSRSQPRPCAEDFRENNSAGVQIDNESTVDHNHRPMQSPSLLPPWPPMAAAPMVPFPGVYPPPPFFHSPFSGPPLPPPMMTMQHLSPNPMAQSHNQPWPSLPTTPPKQMDGRNRREDVQEQIIDSQNDKQQKDEMQDSLDIADDIMRQRTWQTSDQLPDPAVKAAIYKEELRRQIIQKRKDEEAKALREKEEEERLERKIREYEERMKREMIAEQNRIYARGNYESNQAHVLKERDRLTSEDRRRFEEVMEEENRRRDNERQKLEELREKEFKRDGRGDYEEVRKFPQRSSSPPVPTLQKRLDTQCDGSLIYQDTPPQSSRGDTLEERNLAILGNILNSLGAEMQRVEQAIRSKINY